MSEQVITLKHYSESGREAYKKALMSAEDILDLQKRVDSGELENIEGDKSKALPFEIVEKYAKKMKW